MIRRLYFYKFPSFFYVHTLFLLIVICRYPDLFDWFKHFIGFDEASMELLEKKEAMALEDNRQPWSEIDYSTCKRYGPSYRALPANVFTSLFLLYIFLSLSFRTHPSFLFLLNFLLVWHTKVQRAHGALLVGPERYLGLCTHG